MSPQQRREQRDRAARRIRMHRSIQAELAKKGQPLVPELFKAAIKMIVRNAPTRNAACPECLQHKTHDYNCVWAGPVTP